MNTKPLIKLACTKIFGAATGLVDMLVANIPTAREGAPEKVLRTYTGPLTTRVTRAMNQCDPGGPLTGGQLKVSRRCKLDPNLKAPLGFKL